MRPYSLEMIHRGEMNPAICEMRWVGGGRELEKMRGGGVLLRPSAFYDVRTKAKGSVS